MTSGPAFSLTRLRGGIKPFRLYWFARIGSTNSHAAKLRRSEKLFAPAIVLAGKQTAGRGRGNNTWWSGKGGDVLTVTFVLPVRGQLAAQELPMIAGLVVREIAAEFTGNSHIQLKWPNDVLFEGRKLAGLLCERVGNVDLVGIGLNVNVDPHDAPANLRDRITSLSKISGKNLNMTDLLLRLSGQLHLTLRRRLEQPFSSFVREYQKYDALHGKTVQVSPQGEEAAITGKCQGVDDKGRLLIKVNRIVHRIVAGNVILISSVAGGDARPRIRSA
jgi:BirA family transcriptional regulator, biotin operon repressor / biotin---[acetyl-CoA-carboxylase] ligase